LRDERGRGRRRRRRRRRGGRGGGGGRRRRRRKKKRRRWGRAGWVPGSRKRKKRKREKGKRGRCTSSRLDLLMGNSVPILWPIRNKRYLRKFLKKISDFIHGLPRRIFFRNSAIFYLLGPIVLPEVSEIFLFSVFVIFPVVVPKIISAVFQFFLGGTGSFFFLGMAVILGRGRCGC
jgi:hypothetical protein